MNILDRIKLAINPEHVTKMIQEGTAPKNLLDAFYTVSSTNSPPERTDWGLLKAYSRSPFLRQAVSKVAKSFASVEWKVYVARDSDGKAYRDFKMQKAGFVNRHKMINKATLNQTLEELDDYPLTRLLNNWNPWLDGNICKQLVSIYFDLVGDSFSIVERNNRGMPIELWPIPSTWVIQTPGLYQRFFKVEIGTQIFDIPESEILWIKDPDPMKPYGRGTGIARALADELDTDEYSAKYIKQFFYNDAKPPIIVSPKGDIPFSPDDTERLEKNWHKKAGGFWNKFKPYFMSRGVDIKELSQSFQNMQIVELRDWEKNIVGEIWGIPPEILGRLDNSNRATIESAKAILAEHVLVPRLEVMRSILQEKLASQFDEKIILDYVNPIPEDIERKKELMRDHPYAYMIDEIRETSGDDALPDNKGKVRAVPRNLVLIDDNGNVVFDPVTALQESSVSSPQPVEEIVDNSDGEVKSVKKALGDDVVYEVLEALDTEHIAFEVHPLYMEIIKEIAEDAFEDLNVSMSFNLLNPRITTYIQNYIGNKIDIITETTKEMLRAELVEGVQAGESIPQLAKRVTKVFGDRKSGYQATRIARTETMDATNFATLEAYQQSGVVDQLEWIATPYDGRTRDPHLLMDGQIVPIDGFFVVPNNAEFGAGETAQRPHGFNRADLNINCRCSIAAVVDEKSIAGDTVEKRLAYWKTMDSKASGFERAMKSAYVKGMQRQQNAVMDVLKSWGDSDG